MRISCDKSSGDGLNDYAKARRWMVEQQLRRRGIDDSRVLSAMDEVPRERFVSSTQRHEAYADCALPIEAGQTISQPYTVAFMLQEGRIQSTDRVLDVGTGSGYAAAVLSRLAAAVHSIERVPSLAESARRRLEELGYDNVHVEVGDGTKGLPGEAPFDAILVAAGAEKLPPDFSRQLAAGGRIIIPIGASSAGQGLYRYVRRGGQLIEEYLGPFAFVPLIGEQGSEASGDTTDGG